MIAPTQLIAAFVEAWGEVRVQRTRVILSLVGVVAAVAAMSTVIALGDLVVQSNQESMEAWSGRSVTLTLTPGRTTTSQDDTVSGDDGAGDGSQPLPASQVPTPVESSAALSDTGWTTHTTGVATDPVGQAMLTVADRFAIPYWSRMENGTVDLEEMHEIAAHGTFHGCPVPALQDGYQSPMVLAVDPDYRTIFRMEVAQGRWLRSGDLNQRVTPVVINTALWTSLGSPDVRVPLVVSTTGANAQELRVVGVLAPVSAWDSPTIYAPYDSWQLMKPTTDQGASPSMVVWTGEEQSDEARRVLPSALSAVLGEGWEVGVSGGEDFDAGQQTLGMIRTVVMVIGAIVIVLGALGLLNVAIVTVHQRIREIGIRRAVGASAARVFFSVFLESVVATFAAGVIGVAIAIVALRLIPMEALGIFLQDRPPFPTSAAAAGVGIATAVGALCGIIPALAAIRVRPIDAIRY